MTKAKSSRLIKKIIDVAKASGELNCRTSMLREELKSLHIRAEDDDAFLKSRQHPESWRTKDAKDALQERRQFLVREGYLQQQELDALEKLSAEIEAQLKVTTQSLVERLR